MLYQLLDRGDRRRRLHRRRILDADTTYTGFTPLVRVGDHGHPEGTDYLRSAGDEKRKHKNHLAETDRQVVPCRAGLPDAWHRRNSTRTGKVI